MKKDIDRVKSANTEQAEMYKKMLKKLSKDYTALHKYKNKLDKRTETEPELMTISEFFDASRTRVVKLRDTELTELDKAGAAQNNRYKIDFKIDDEPVEGFSKGDIVTGQFTPDKTRSNDYKPITENNPLNEDDEKAITDHLLEKYPDEAEFIKSLKENSGVTAYIREKTESVFRSHSDKIIASTSSVKVAVDNIKESYTLCKRHTPQGIATIEAIGDNQARLCAYLEYTSIYLKEHANIRLCQQNQINLTGAQGKSNALVSAIAEVFGCSEVIAFSEKMKIEARKNGKKTVKTGVMMMPA